MSLTMTFVLCWDTLVMRRSSLISVKTVPLLSIVLFCWVTSALSSCSTIDLSIFAQGGTSTVTRHTFALNATEGSVTACGVTTVATGVNRGYNVDSYGIYYPVYQSSSFYSSKLDGTEQTPLTTSGVTHTDRWTVSVDESLFGSVLCYGAWSSGLYCGIYNRTTNTVDNVLVHNPTGAVQLLDVRCGGTENCTATYRVGSWRFHVATLTVDGGTLSVLGHRLLVDRVLGQYDHYRFGLSRDGRVAYFNLACGESLNTVFALSVEAPSIESGDSNTQVCEQETAAARIGELGAVPYDELTDHYRVMQSGSSVMLVHTDTLQTYTILTNSYSFSLSRVVLHTDASRLDDTIDAILGVTSDDQSILPQWSGIQVFYPTTAPTAMPTAAPTSEPTMTPTACVDAQQHVIATLPEALSVRVSDVDGDGDDDVVAGSFVQGLVWLENVSGNFSEYSEHTISATIGRVMDIAVSDVNLDNLPDVVAVDNTGNQLQLFVAASAGVFGAGVVVASSVTNPARVKVADVTGDAFPDIFVTGQWLDKVLLYVNDGSGAFPSQTVLASSVDGPFGLELFDADGDGDDDLAVGTIVDDNILYFEHIDGNGTYASPTVLASIDSVRSLTAADFDDSGRSSLLSTSDGTDQVAMHWNEGGGVWTLHDVIGSGIDPFAATYGTFHPTSRAATPDIVVAFRTGPLRLYRNYGARLFVEQIVSNDVLGGIAVSSGSLLGVLSSDIIASASKDDDKIAFYTDLCALAAPSLAPTRAPTSAPTSLPTNAPTQPTEAPTLQPTSSPWQPAPTSTPTVTPTNAPSLSPTAADGAVVPATFSVGPIVNASEQQQLWPVRIRSLPRFGRLYQRSTARKRTVVQGNAGAPLWIDDIVDDPNAFVEYEPLLAFNGTDSFNFSAPFNSSTEETYIIDIGDGVGAQMPCSFLQCVVGATCWAPLSACVCDALHFGNGRLCLAMADVHRFDSITRLVPPESLISFDFDGAVVHVELSLDRDVSTFGEVAPLHFETGRSVWFGGTLHVEFVDADAVAKNETRQGAVISGSDVLVDSFDALESNVNSLLSRQRAASWSLVEGVGDVLLRAIVEFSAPESLNDGELVLIDVNEGDGALSPDVFDYLGDQSMVPPLSFDSIDDSDDVPPFVTVDEWDNAAGGTVVRAVYPSGNGSEPLRRLVVNGDIRVENGRLTFIFVGATRPVGVEIRGSLIIPGTLLEMVYPDLTIDTWPPATQPTRARRRRKRTLIGLDASEWDNETPQCDLIVGNRTLLDSSSFNVVASFERDNVRLPQEGEALCVLMSQSAFSFERCFRQAFIDDRSSIPVGGACRRAFSQCRHEQVEAGELARIVTRYGASLGATCTALQATREPDFCVACASNAVEFGDADAAIAQLSVVEKLGVSLGGLTALSLLVGVGAALFLVMRRRLLAKLDAVADEETVSTMSTAHMIPNDAERVTTRRAQASATAVRPLSPRRKARVEEGGEREELDATSEEDGEESQQRLSGVDAGTPAVAVEVDAETEEEKGEEREEAREEYRVEEIGKEKETLKRRPSSKRKKRVKKKGTQRELSFYLDALKDAKPIEAP